MHMLRREFQVRKLFYNYRNERVFYCCQWRWPRPVFVIIRVILGAYTIYGLIHMFVNHYANDDRQEPPMLLTNTTSGHLKTEESQKQPIMVFFTVWSYILLTVHMVLAAILSIVFFKRAESDVSKLKLRPVSIIERPAEDSSELADAKKIGNAPGGEIQTFTVDTGSAPMSDRTYVPNTDNKLVKQLTTSSESDGGNKNGSGRRLSSYESFRRYHGDHFSSTTPIYFKISWCLADIVGVIAPIVTIIFFSALYPTMKDRQAVGLNIQDTNVHTLNLVFVVVDHLISPRPIRLLHFLAPLVYGAVYILFSVIYWSTDHENHVVYKNVLDWNYPGVASGVSLGLAFVAIPLIQFSFFGLYQLKCLIHKKLYDCSFNGDLD